MSERLDLLAPIKGKDGKTFWRKLGSAWPAEGGGFNIEADVMSAPEDGKWRFIARPPRDKKTEGEPF